jgi:hypothetical protein
VKNHQIPAVLGLAMAMVQGASPSFAGDPSDNIKQQTPVIVYVLQDSPSLSGRDVAVAESRASKMFVAVGVRIVWKHREASTLEIRREHPIVLQIALDTPTSELPGAFAFALPYEGIHVRIFYDRIRSIPNTTFAILAHVLVHEITHMLQGIDHHSETGVMKPHWSAQDYDDMGPRPFPFATVDIELIRKGLAKRY